MEGFFSVEYYIVNTEAYEKKSGITVVSFAHKFFTLKKYSSFVYMYTYIIE